MYKPNNSIKAKNTKKIQFNCFCAYSNFTDLLITPKELPQERIASEYQKNHGTSNKMVPRHLYPSHVSCTDTQTNAHICP